MLKSKVGDLSACDKGYKECGDLFKYNYVTDWFIYIKAFVSSVQCFFQVLLISIAAFMISPVDYLIIMPSLSLVNRYQ